MSTATIPRAKFLQAAVQDLAHRPKSNIPALDLFRSAAILLVVGFHVGQLYLGNPYFSFGWTGVDLFFVLSGFLIGGQLLRELHSTGTVRIGAFILRRGYRIWPLYFAFAITVAFCVSLRASWPDLLCVSNYFLGSVAGGWSLSTEEQFYILLPVILFLGSKVVRPSLLIAIPILWLLLIPVSRWISIRLNAVDLYSPFHVHSEGLALGVAIAWLAVLRGGRVSRPRTCVLVILSSILLALFLRRVNHLIFVMTAWTIVYGAFVWSGLQVSFLPRLVRWHGFYILSRLSYGVYLNHIWLIRWIQPHVQPSFGESYPGFLLVWWLVMLPISMAAAFLTFALIEFPFLQMRQRRAGRSRGIAGLKYGGKGGIRTHGTR